MTHFPLSQPPHSLLGLPGHLSLDFEIIIRISFALCLLGPEEAVRLQTIRHHSSRGNHGERDASGRGCPAPSLLAVGPPPRPTCTRGVTGTNGEKPRPWLSGCSAAAPLLLRWPVGLPAGLALARVPMTRPARWGRPVQGPPCAPEMTRRLPAEGPSTRCQSSRSRSSWKPGASLSREAPVHGSSLRRSAELGSEKRTALSSASALGHGLGGSPVPRNPFVSPTCDKIQD